MKEEKIWTIKDGYLVNRDGSIYKLNWRNTGTMRKVSQRRSGAGYLRFNCNDKSTLVHRFIAECFIPNPNNLPEINHKNEDKTDNRVENLEWCDHKYNCNYGTRIERVVESQKNNPKICKKVNQYTKDGILVKEWFSASEIERVLGFDNTNISKCCLGKLKSAYGFIWTHQPITQ